MAECGQGKMQAMLDQLTLLGKAERITQAPDSCLPGSCRGCPEGQACKTVIYRPIA